MNRFAVLGCVCALTSAAIGSDNNVQWDLLSHETRYDLRPMVPMGGESFVARLLADRDDLTGARVGYWVDGAFVGWIDAAAVGVEGPKDIWGAPIPSVAGTTVEYVFEVIDGSDSDYVGADGPSETLPGERFVVDFGTLEHARMGATPVDGGTVFRVWAPTRSSVQVRGEFNGWSTGDALSKVGEDFIGFVAGAEAGDMYKYYFNNSHWNTDPHAAELVASDNLNARISDPLAYQWQHNGFAAPPLDEWVVYQLHVGTFAGRNDPFGPTGTPSGYRDVGERASHLSELGVNVVMLNPINEWPGTFSGGYNPITMYGWESSLGSAEDLKYMVDQLHGEGIAVILDVVWNHFASSDNFLWGFDGSQQYFDSPAQDTPWGAQADFDKQGVFDYFLDSVHHVMGEFRMDGYRHDAVMAMTDSGWTAQWDSGQDLMRAMNRVIDRRYSDAHAIAEIYIDSDWVINGIEFDSQYHNSFKNSMRDAVFGASFGSPNIAGVAAALDGTGSVSGTEVFNYFELHDDAWPLNGHERAVRQIDTSFPHDDDFARGRTTLANTLTILSKGIPAILHGTEWLENDGWEENKIDWSHKSTYDGVFRMYQDVIALRTGEAALRANQPAWVYHTNNSADVLAFERWEIGGDSYVVVANFSNDDYGDYRVGLPRAGAWDVVFNSQSGVYDGSGYGTSGTIESEPVGSGPHGQSVSLQLPAMGVLVLRNSADIGCPADLNDDGELNFFDVSAFLVAYTGGDLSVDFDGSGTLDFFDVSTFLVAFNAGCP
ncbi:MAG: alpha amylase C-terminal domain-containing protein [bacterium]|nr:alpha amylase C-terminal domain-containing protein [bacterium]